MAPRGGDARTRPARTTSLSSRARFGVFDLLSFGDKERAHHEAMLALKLCGIPPIRQLLRSFTFVKNERTVFGVTFPNPVGVAAGFDKFAVGLYGIQALGFGFAEVGTVTPNAQPGNPKPRLFRLDEDGAVVNRMGFNNDGVGVIARRLGRYRSLRTPVGINIGKGRDTPLERAHEDYVVCARGLRAHADYFAVNISSPNTKDLRRLHERAYLAPLLDSVRGAAGGTPVLLKLSPDLDERALDEALEAAAPRVEGFVVCNTTVARPKVLHSRYSGEAGGLSGLPLRARALEMVRTVHAALPETPIVGVGGIFGPDDAERMFDAGASLVQLYTGLVFEGPLLARRINQALAENL